MERVMFLVGAGSILITFNPCFGEYKKRLGL